MTLIKKPNELTTSKIKLKGLIYGQPGIGKTSLALSAPKPLLIDFDNGLRRVAKQYQTDSVQIESYQNLLDILTQEGISGYETIVIDTLGKMIDKMALWLADSNPKVNQANGQLSMQGWGFIVKEFKRLLQLLENQNRSFIFIAHEKEEKVGDEVIKRPDVAGSSVKELVKDLDFMGYMSIKGGKRTIDLAPNEAYYAKNSLGLDSFLEYKPLIGINNFLSTAIFDAYQEKLRNDDKLAKEYDILIQNLKTKINNIKDLDQLNSYYSAIYNKHDKFWSSYEMEKSFLTEKVKELNCEFDKKSKEFISNKKEEVKND
jgi:phage nucleotide-binding protein